MERVKAQLVAHIKTYSDKPLSDEARHALREALSMPDTLIDSKYVFDFLVDLAILYDYDKKKRLTMVIGYHWD